MRLAGLGDNGGQNRYSVVVGRSRLKLPVPSMIDVQVAISVMDMHDPWYLQLIARFLLG